jgi:deoxyribose-phosphate aldolase
MSLENITPEILSAMIDHTFLRPYGKPGEIEKLCDEARHYSFAMVAINPAEVTQCVRLLAGSPVRVGAAIGFPLGQNTRKVKDYETRDAIQNGAGEIDMVINLRALQSGDYSLVRNEIADMVHACQPAGVICKVILETCYLSDPEKRLVCQIAREEGADFVKTSTGFAPAGAKVEDVRLMRAEVGRQMGVKAAGGIHNLSTTRAMIAAGANRIGTSAGVKILEELLAYSNGSIRPGDE